VSTMKPHQRMRVLHVTETLPGGPAAYLNEILPWQLRKLTPGDVGLLAPESQLDALNADARGGLIVHGYPRSGRNPLALLALHRALRKVLATWRPDLIHAHCSFAGAVVRLTRTTVPVIYCPHGWAFSRETSALVRATYTWVERALQRRAATIVAISEHEKEAAIAAGIDRHRVTLIRHGLSPLTAMPSRSFAREPGSALKLLFIGRLDRQKGLDWLLRAIADIPPQRVQLTVVGAPVIDAQHRLASTENARFLGWLDPSSVSHQLDCADALIVPSRWEGFGLVAIEAMRRGVPVLVSNRGALPEVVGHGEAGLIFDLDRPESLPALLDSLCADTLNRLSAAGRARFAAQFAGDRMNLQTLDLYTTILSAHGSVRRSVEDEAELQP
jgi:glycosyltransferase involved in cell wall biosynthesis